MTLRRQLAHQFGQYRQEYEIIKGEITQGDIQMNEDDQTIASLLFEGCSMGIETLYKYLHQYENASSKIKEVTEKLIEIEKELSQNIQNYL